MNNLLAEFVFENELSLWWRWTKQCSGTVTDENITSFEWPDTI